MLEKGKGCLFLHHAIVSYQDWDEYEKILGGRFLSEAVMKDGREIYPASGWEHDQDIDVKVEDKKHSVTKGIKNFTIHDETYSFCRISDSVHILLSTDNPFSNKYLAWTNHYGNSRIVYIQLGHDSPAFENPDYKKLVKNAIYWVSEK